MYTYKYPWRRIAIASMVISFGLIVVMNFLVDRRDPTLADIKNLRNSDAAEFKDLQIKLIRNSNHALPLLLLELRNMRESDLIKNDDDMSYAVTMLSLVGEISPCDYVRFYITGKYDTAGLRLLSLSLSKEALDYCSSAELKSAVISRFDSLKAQTTDVEQLKLIDAIRTFFQQSKKQ